MVIFTLGTYAVFRIANNLYLKLLKRLYDSRATFIVKSLCKKLRFLVFCLVIFRKYHFGSIRIHFLWVKLKLFQQPSYIAILLTPDLFTHYPNKFIIRVHNPHCTWQTYIPFHNRELKQSCYKNVQLYISVIICAPN